ncbi:hypothetical protein VTH8203_03364 [Vibrio thalassae]|uniref:Uncharacterized protein n=1 Tax=Vibrio thalassae TaxID=1243014 RepID=A0A240EM78_9VIBR|nr:hypothetical protein VTH8203_03364 [Vibrio thalassae]
MNSLLNLLRILQISVVYWGIETMLKGLTPIGKFVSSKVLTIWARRYMEHMIMYSPQLMANP